MAFGYECESCGTFVEVDPDDDVPGVRVKTVAVEEGEGHVEDGEFIPTCSDCREEAYGRATEAVRG